MRRLIYITVFLIAAASLQAQEKEFKSSNFRDDKDAFKIAEEQFETGEDLVMRAIELESEGKRSEQTWRDALGKLMKAQDFNPSYSRLNYLIGRSLDALNRLPEAGPYLNKAVSLNPDVEPYTYFLLAKEAQQRLALDEARDYLKDYEARAKSRDLEEMDGLIKKLKLEIRYAEDFSSKPLERVWVDNLTTLNSSKSELIPNIPADGSEVIYNRIDPGTGEVTIMRSERNDMGWSNPEVWQDGGFEGYEVIAVSQDGQEAFLSGDQEGSPDIYYIELKGTKWSAPKRMPELKINTDMNETHASFYFDRIKFYFVTDNDYANKGGQDIFFSGRINTTFREEWGRAHPMGSEVNTPWDEGSVFMHPDGKTVYFASNGHNSMGGYDIFRTVRLPGRWAPPENLGYPVNTPYDEIYFTISPSGKHGYVSSNRPGGAGDFDIYRVTFLGPPKPNMVDYRDHLLSSMAEPMVERSMEAAKEVETVNLTILKGVVLDAFTNKPLEASIEITDNEKNELISVFRSNSASGKFLVSLPAGKNYGIAVTAPDYLFHSENFDLPDNSEYQMVEKEIKLTNACIGCSIVLNNIFFDTGKHNLRPESTAELNRLTELLKNILKIKPGTKVEISGHTDNTGSESLNQRLSENRAKSVVEYLAKQGIPSTTLTFKGYGSAEPVASNATAAGRQQNRRTEFKIIE